MIILKTFIFLWLIAGSVPQTAAFDEASETNTSSLYSRYSANVIQVRVIDRSTGSKTGIGSGFRISEDGKIITNFHVIAEIVAHPKRYQLEYEQVNGAKGSLHLVAFDVVHDLALLTSDRINQSYLDLSNSIPIQGQRIYALGNPLDLGFTIVEGTFNGFLEKSMYKKIHFTGSLNPGMSGGPVLNRDGDVVGINVATSGNQVSFLVPVSYAIELIDAKFSANNFNQKVSEQLLANQQTYIENIVQADVIQSEIGDFKVPGKLANYLKCWGDTNDQEDSSFVRVYQNCSSSDYIYLSREQTSGHISYRHDLYSAKDIGATGFFTFLQSEFSDISYSLGGSEDAVTNYQCEESFVSFTNLESKIIFCLRRYKRYPGLYDGIVKLATIGDNQQVLLSTLELSGVSVQSAMTLTKKYVNAFSWNKHVTD